MGYGESKTVEIFVSSNFYALSLCIVTHEPYDYVIVEQFEAENIPLVSEGLVSN